MSITIQSAKAKGRNLQKWVVAKLLEVNPFLEPDDVVSTSMGAAGEDIKLSPAARRVFPFSVECKARKNIAVYDFYEQAQINAKEHTPLVVIKADRKKPLAILDAELFIRIMRGVT